MPISNKLFYNEPLSCHCPQCYSNSGLELRFHQEWTENLLRKKATTVVSEELFCKQCSETIYPVHWDSDIERLYEYHNKRAEPSSYAKWKSLFWILMILLVLGIVATAYVTIYL